VHDLRCSETHTCTQTHTHIVIKYTYIHMHILIHSCMYYDTMYVCACMVLILCNVHLPDTSIAKLLNSGHACEKHPLDFIRHIHCLCNGFLCPFSCCKMNGLRLRIINKIHRQRLYGLIIPLFHNKSTYPIG